VILVIVHLKWEDASNFTYFCMYNSLALFLKGGWRIKTQLDMDVNKDAIGIQTEYTLFLNMSKYHCRMITNIPKIINQMEIMKIK
jgi:hypothetical protein